MPMLNETDLYCGWQHESFRVIGGEDPCFEKQPASLACCRNDWAAASIAIRYTAPAVLLMEDRADFTPAGPVLTIRPKAVCPGLDVTLYRTDMVLDDDQVYKADPILCFLIIDLLVNLLI